MHALYALAVPTGVVAVAAGAVAVAAGGVAVAAGAVAVAAGAVADGRVVAAGPLQAIKTKTMAADKAPGAVILRNSFLL
jgi:hypothetical protein